MIKIEAITLDSMREFVEGRLEGMTVPKDSQQCFGLFLEGKLACVGSVVLHSKTANIKTLYTSKEYRGRGYGSRMTRYLKVFVKNSCGSVKRDILVDCLKASLGIFLKEGSEVVKLYKHGGAKVVLRYENIQKRVRPRGV